jgi:Fe-S cluster assembly protein SufD
MTTATTTSGFSPANLQHLSGPDWLAQYRLQALGIYNSRAVPTTKVEAWKYTNLRRFKPENFVAPLPVATVSGIEALPEKIRERLSTTDAAGRIVMSGNSVIFSDIPQELADQGVIFSDLRTALETHPALVQQYLYSVVGAAYPEPTTLQIERHEHIPHHDEDKFTSLNAALWENGFFVYVPKNVELALPLGGFRYLDQNGTFVAARTLVVVERNAKLTYIDEMDSPDLKSAANFGAVELFLAEGAQLRYVSINNWGRGITHIQRIKSTLGRDASLNSLYVTMGSSLSRTEVQSALDGSGANSEMLAIYFADKDQHFDHYTLQHHNKDRAHSDLLFKGVLSDSARSVFSGLIKVELGAQKTDAYQKNRTLLLSDEARSDSIPQLEINANDVRCSHGSTTGPVDQQELFYLRSRGIPKPIAEKMLVTAFLEDVLNRVPLKNVVKYLEGIIADKVGAPKGFNRIETSE